MGGVRTGTRLDEQARVGPFDYTLDEGSPPRTGYTLDEGWGTWADRNEQWLDLDERTPAYTLDKPVASTRPSPGENRLLAPEGPIYTLGRVRTFK